MSSSKKNAAANSGPPTVLNKKARYEYEIIDTLEAGIALTGAEVKAIRQGNVQLKESYVKVKGKECFLVGCHITAYSFAADQHYNPTRERKLLLHRREILKLERQVMQKGLTVVPMKLYFTSNGRCKLQIGVGRGKKLHDKRQSIKEKEISRQLERYK